MPLELDLPAKLAGLMFLGILGGSGVLWILYLQQSRGNFDQNSNLPAWPIGWVNFGIFLCALVASVAAVQIIAGGFIQGMSDGNEVAESTPSAEYQSLDYDTENARTAELTPWMAVCAVLLLQLPLLATFYGLRQFYPSSFAGSLNHVSLTFRQVFAQTIPQFIQYLPIIWIASYLWSMLLTTLQRMGLIDAFPPQQLIQLFTKGGDPLAITLLVLFAVILAPIVEETIFRGGIYRFLKSQTTPLPAQIISGALFAVMHGNLMSLLPLVIVGILLAQAYERSGNIMVPICFHACFNAYNLLVLLLMSQSSMTLN